MFVPPTFVGILLKIDLPPVQAWAHSHDAVVTSGLSKERKNLLNWLQAVLLRSGPHAVHPIVVTKITAPVTYRELFPCHHQLLVRDFPGLEPYLYCAQVLMIAVTIGEITVELRADF